MAILTAAAVYLLAFVAFSFVAVRRARRSGDPIKSALLPTCGGLGFVAALVDPTHVVIFACVAVSAATDLSSGYVYDAVLAIAITIVLAQAIFGGHLSDAIVGASSGYLLSWLLRAVTRGRGLGLGDVKLFAAVGAALGGGAFVVAFGLSFVIGAVSVLAPFVLRTGRLHRVVRFAPYIALGTVGAATCHLGL